MAIQCRRGPYNKFDPQKCSPAEWNVITSGDPNAADGLSVYICFKAGVVKRMATFEDMVENIDQASGEAIAKQIQAAISAAINACENATQAAQTQASAAEQAAADARTAITAVNQAASAANTAAERAIKAAENIEGLIDNTRVTNLETKVNALTQAMGNTLSTE